MLKNWFIAKSCIVVSFRKYLSVQFETKKFETISHSHHFGCGNQSKFIKIIGFVLDDDCDEDVKISQSKEIISNYTKIMIRPGGPLLSVRRS